MKREYYKQHSDVLNEDMSMIVYGEGGYPVIAFQAQDAKSNNFEDFGMIDVLAPYIEDGRIQVFSVDNLDEESWSDEGGDKGARAWRQEEYFQFVTDELIPRVHSWNNSDRRPIAVGCSMGATHAAIAAFRRPDLFQGCIALSGVYRTSFFFGDWMDENLYNNDVPAFLSNMPADHPYVTLYNERQLVLCVGQGAWEAGVDDLHFIDEQLNRLGVEHWCDFWGTDVNHDWPWWRKQMPYFMNEVLSEIEDAAVMAPAQEEKPAVEEAPAAPAKKAPAKRATTRKAPAKKAAPKAAEAEVTEEVSEEVKAAAEAVEAAAKKPARKTAAKKAPAKRTTTRKTAAQKKAEAEAAVAEATTEAPAEAAEAPAKKTTTRKPAAKKTATRKTAAQKKAEAAAAEAVTEAAVEAAVEAAEAPAKKTTTRKPAAKKTTTRATAAKKTAAKPAAKRTTTRKTAAAKKAEETKADTAE